MIIETAFNIGEDVWDDLTNKKAKIIGITFSSGYTQGNLCRKSVDTIGYWLDNEYLYGGRHPWEITKLNCKANREKGYE